MIIGEKLTEIAERIPEVYEAGQKSEYDRFWDTCQEYGNRKDYTYGFSGYCWNDETFKPKYNIRCTNGLCLFISAKINDFKGILERQGVELDTSQATNTNQLFYSSAVRFLPKIDFSNSQAYRTFYGCTELVSIDELVFNPDKNIDVEMFYNCYNLVELRIGGVIAKNFNVSFCKKLSAESYYSIITALSSSVSGQKFIVPPTAEATYNANPPQGEGVPQTWAALIATKSNWTIAE